MPPDKQAVLEPWLAVTRSDSLIEQGAIGRAVGGYRPGGRRNVALSAVCGRLCLRVMSITRRSARLRGQCADLAVELYAHTRYVDDGDEGQHAFCDLITPVTHRAGVPTRGPGSVTPRSAKSVARTPRRRVGARQESNGVVNIRLDHFGRMHRFVSYFLAAIRRFTVVTSSDQLALRFW